MTDSPAAPSVGGRSPSRTEPATVVRSAGLGARGWAELDPRESSNVEVQVASSAEGCDLLVLGVAQAEAGPQVVGSGLDPEQLRALTAAARDVGASGKRDEVIRLPGAPFGVPPVVLTGLGPLPVSPEHLRQAAGAALRAAETGSVAVALPHAGWPELAAAGEGALIGAYRIRDDGKPHPRCIVLVTHLGEQRVGGLQEGAPELADIRTVGNAVHLTRRLVDCPPGDLPPSRLASIAAAVLEGLPVSVEILDEAALAEQGFGGILAVGQGSANPPRLVRIAYSPKQDAKHLVLIGKGITFDSGGLSLKPAAGMAAMKSDMAGAAAVLATVAAIAQLHVPLRITGYLAIAENMPSGTAQRPGDVIRSFNGTTVEVLNTDAEGRLVLMDVLGRCGADSPDAIVDIATLTGAQLVALGPRIAGVMGNDDDLRAEVVASATAAGELAWPMPIPDDLRTSLDSPIADLANIGERNGGMMTAAAFLREFVPAGVPWAHMDIAGPAFVTGNAWGYNAKGATGYGVRTLIELARRMATR